MDLGILWQVLKWVLVVVAAGFVGQFGRHLAKLILERRRQARVEAGSPHASPGNSHEVEKAKLELEKKKAKDQEKLEKKRAKAEVKKAKKATDPDED